MKLFRAIKLALMCRKADKFCRITKKRWHVIENKGKLKIVNDGLVDIYNSKVKRNKHKININTLLKQALYSTK